MSKNIRTPNEIRKITFVNDTRFSNNEGAQIADCRYSSTRRNRYTANGENSKTVLRHERHLYRFIDLLKRIRSKCAKCI